MSVSRTQSLILEANGILALSIMLNVFPEWVYVSLFAYKIWQVR